jgi:HPt (histidine-containing phosphotransfer) domain-containing protein
MIPAGTFLVTCWMDKTVLQTANGRWSIAAPIGLSKPHALVPLLQEFQQRMLAQGSELTIRRWDDPQQQVPPRRPTGGYVDPIAEEVMREAMRNAANASYARDAWNQANYR